MGGRSGQSINNGGGATSKVEFLEIQTKGYTGGKLSDEEKKYFAEYSQKVIKSYGIKGDLLINTYYKRSDTNGEFSIRQMKADGTWYAGSADGKSEITINLKNLKTKAEIEEVIRHELKHVQQGQNGFHIKLESDGNRYYYWQGKKFGEAKAVNKLMSKYETYIKLPWEIEAYETKKDKF